MMTEKYERITKVIADLDVELKKTENEARVIADKKKSQKADLDAIISLYEERGDCIVGKNEDFVYIDEKTDATFDPAKGNKILHRFKAKKGQGDDLFSEKEVPFVTSWHVNKQMQAEAEYEKILNDLNLEVKISKGEKVFSTVIE